MDERELDTLLAAAAREDFRPSAETLEATRQRLYRTPLLQASVFASLALQSLGWTAAVLAILSPAVAHGIKLAIFFGGLALWGCVLVALLSVRRALIPCLRRLDSSATAGGWR